MDTSITTQNTPNTGEVATKKIHISLSTTSSIQEQRLKLFRLQESKVEAFYATNTNQAVFYLDSKKAQFLETKKFKIASSLTPIHHDTLENFRILFDRLYLIDDLLMEVVDRMPAQRPIGWQMFSSGQNLLNLPTVGQLKGNVSACILEQSVAATILQFLGVASFTNDRGHFIGHILGYLFCCYYFAHLGVSYSAMPLTEEIVSDYPYQWVTVPQLVRLLQQIDEDLKIKIYQLAVFSAQISEYSLDKYIEKRLIMVVNSFHKQHAREALLQNVAFEYPKPDLFQPLKPLR